MNSIKNFKTGLFLGIFSLFFAFSFGQGLALTKVAFAQEPPTEAEKVQTFYSEKDLKQYKISSLKRFYLNFQLKFAPGPATKLTSAFKIWADRLYRLNSAKKKSKLGRINKELDKYLGANTSFEKALGLARATLEDIEVDKILGIQDIIEKYTGFSDVAINVLEGVRIIYAEVPELASQGEALTAARRGLDENLRTTENLNREAQRIASDPLYREYVKALKSGRLTPAQKSLLTLNFFKAQRERAGVAQ